MMGISMNLITIGRRMRMIRMTKMMRKMRILTMASGAKLFRATTTKKMYITR